MRLGQIRKKCKIIVYNLELKIDSIVLETREYKKLRYYMKLRYGHAHPILLIMLRPYIVIERRALRIIFPPPPTRTRLLNVMTTFLPDLDSLLVKC